MPMEKKEDFGNKDENCQSCVHCTNPDGSVLSCEEVFEGGVEFFKNIPGVDTELAERITRKNMNALPYWQEHGNDVLKGEEATDEEFRSVLEKLI